MRKTCGFHLFTFYLSTFIVFTLRPWARYFSVQQDSVVSLGLLDRLRDYGTPCMMAVQLPPGGREVYKHLCDMFLQIEVVLDNIMQICLRVQTSWKPCT